MKDEIYNQAGGDGSTNIQGTTVNISGLSYSDVKTICQDLFKDNFLALRSAAKETADERIEEFQQEFLNRLQERFPEVPTSIGDPGVHSAIFEGQKAYAMSGDSDVGGNVITLLIDRISAEKRTLYQLLVAESLVILPKLTSNELNILAALFFIKCIEIQVPDLPTLEKAIRLQLLPFIESSVPKKTSLKHLDYCGCISLPRGMSIGTMKIEQHFFQKYQHILPEDYSLEMMRAWLDAIDPVLAEALNTWNIYEVAQADLTYVGIIIAEAHYSRRTGERTKIDSLFE